ncbi:MAG: putative Fe-S cluster assembly protein SufT [Candidatus Marinimicrobia bacterium]|nr:putative Fe-S cluster assembly protein SufT [Candidatus Neomarinimicrobiota bacterium]
MFNDDIITLSRDCKAVLIPAGEQVTLLKGARVRITQALGGDYTLSVNGSLVRISGEDADAIGIETEILAKQNNLPLQDFDESIIWDQLKTCYDPEIPINIVDLGLVYDLEIDEPVEGKRNVIISMTLTAPGCGMGPFIARDVETKVQTVSGVENVMVKLVWDPMWNKDMMTDEAKLQLGML